jgi:hypothetical protein
MSTLGKKIKLIGLSQKGKNRIREMGNEWTVLAETDRVLFASNQPGPWLFICPYGKNQHDTASRWIKAVNDQDFAIVSHPGLDE